MSIKTRVMLSDALPFWFAMTSPLIGILAGIVIVSLPIVRGFPKAQASISLFLIA